MLGSLTRTLRIRVQSSGDGMATEQELLASVYSSELRQTITFYPYSIVLCISLEESTVSHSSVHQNLHLQVLNISGMRSHYSIWKATSNNPELYYQTTNNFQSVKVRRFINSKKATQTFNLPCYLSLDHYLHFLGAHTPSN